MLENADAIRLKAKFFRGFADPTRLAILESLLAGEKNVNQLVEELGISQPNASGHLACLRDCGLVTSENRGRFTFYRLYDRQIRNLLHTAETILAQVGQGVFACTRYEELGSAAPRRIRRSRASPAPPASFKADRRAQSNHANH